MAVSPNSRRRFLTRPVSVVRMCLKIARNSMVFQRSDFRRLGVCSGINCQNIATHKFWILYVAAGGCLAGGCLHASKYRLHKRILTSCFERVQCSFTHVSPDFRTLRIRFCEAMLSKIEGHTHQTYDPNKSEIEAHGIRQNGKSKSDKIRKMTNPMNNTKTPRDKKTRNQKFKRKKQHEIRKTFLSCGCGGERPIYIYIYICTPVYIYIYICIYI